MAKTAAPKAFSIPKINLKRISIPLEGTSALICHAWSHKAKGLMLDKQMKKAKQAKEAKNPFVDFCDSLYWLTPERNGQDEAALKKALPKAKFSFPAVAFKSAAVSACSHVDGMTKVAARGSFHIDCDMIEIESGPPTMREDMVRIGMGTADIRYRGEFAKWRVTLPVTYNSNVISAEQILNLFETAGFAIGVGEWRPEKNGSYGRFHVARG